MSRSVGAFRPFAFAFLLIAIEVFVMDRNFGTVMPLVLKHEGGFANHPKDPGGATMKGVTLATFQKYKPGASVADLKAISDDMLNRIYRDGYWSKVRGDQLPSGLDYAVFDFAVNSGPSRAARYLQGLLGVEQDGIIGPKTLNALAGRDVKDLVNALCDARLAFLKGLKTWGTFGKGWASRVAGVRKKALAMTGEPAEPSKPVPAPEVPETQKEPPAATEPALPLDPGTVVVVVPSEPKPPETKNRFVAWLIDIITAIFWPERK